MSSFVFLLSLCGFFLPATALPATLQPRDTLQAYQKAPRLVSYVQTFRYSDGSRVSLTPLLEQNTGVTHVNLAALHINDDPNAITLNDRSPEDAYYEETWQEAKSLQDAGIKVLFMLGGAAKGSYLRLCSNATPGKTAVIVG